MLMKNSFLREHFIYVIDSFFVQQHQLQVFNRFLVAELSRRQKSGQIKTTCKLSWPWKRSISEQMIRACVLIPSSRSPTFSFLGPSPTSLLCFKLFMMSSTLTTFLGMFVLMSHHRKPSFMTKIEIYRKSSSCFSFFLHKTNQQKAQGSTLHVCICDDRTEKRRSCFLNKWQTGCNGCYGNLLTPSCHSLLPFSHIGPWRFLVLNLGFCSVLFIRVLVVLFIFLLL